MNTTVHVRVHRMPLTILPTVFNPSFFKSCNVFLKYLESLDLRDKNVLDAGTGSGVLGIAVSQMGARVTAIDINPAAVACAQQNAQANGVNINALQSDWFSALSDNKYDVILCNGPFIKGPPHPPFDITYYTGDHHELISPFIDGFADHLAPDGFALFMLSSDADISWFIEQFISNNLKVQIAARKKYFFEEFMIIRVSRG